MRFLTVEAALFPELNAEAAGPPIHGVQYIGNKRKLLDWIREQIPDGTKRVVDAFAGGGSVSYMLKREGFEVVSNDSLKWPYHICRATVVNQGDTVTDEEIEALVAPNAKAGDFVRKHYAGKFWKEGVHQAIDEVRENIDALAGFKKDIALAALGGTMLSARGWFPQFTTSKVADGGYTPEEFRERLGMVIRRLNEMVIEGPECEAFNLDVQEFLPKAKADLAYFDPPYVTEFSAANYSVNYHVIEAVMVKGVGRNPSTTSKNRTEKTQADLTRKNITEFFTGVFKAAEHIPNWLLSYRDKAFPGEDEIKKIFTDAGREVDLQSKSHTYTLAGTNRDGDPSKALEYLFVGTKGKAQKKAASKTEPGMKTPVIALADGGQALDSFWEEKAQAIVDTFGWHGLAIACAVVDAGYPAREFEGELPKALDAYHLPVMIPDGDTLAVVAQAVSEAQAGLQAQAFYGRLNESDRSLCQTKLARLEAWTQVAETLAAQAGDTGSAPGAPSLADLLVVANRKNAGQQAAASLSTEVMVSVASEKGDEGDHAIKFILCHAGSNKNADHFTVDELKAAAPSAAGIKINLKHGQKAQDIVGKTESASFEDAENGRIVCGGKLFTAEDELAAKARKLIHEKLITKVSMECSYTEGECSVCGNKHKTAAERCDHLKNHKGGKVDGKDCFEILHGVKFTGAGLLEGYEPADPKADITAMAHQGDGRMYTAAYGGLAPARAQDRPETMKQVLVLNEVREDLWKTDDAFHQVTRTLVDQFAAEAETLDGVSTKLRQAANDYADRVIQILKSTFKETPVEKPTDSNAKALSEMTREELLAHTQQLQERVAADEAAKQAADAAAAAEKLVTLMEKKGRAFADAAARTAEVEKLAKLTDEARKAIEDTWSALPDKAQAKTPEEEAAAAAQAAAASRTNADGTPIVSPDGSPATLSQKLGTVIMAAFNQRLEATGS